jgi:hypothetical protein
LHSALTTNSYSCFTDSLTIFLVLQGVSEVGGQGDRRFHIQEGVGQLVILFQEIFGHSRPLIVIQGAHLVVGNNLEVAGIPLVYSHGMDFRE